MNLNRVALAHLLLCQESHELKKGMVAFLKEKPCKFIEVTTSKTGKHGHAKANITGIDIFTGKKYIDISPTSHTMYQPVVDTNDWTVTDIDDEGFVTLMDDDGNQKEDLQLPTRTSYLTQNLEKKLRLPLKKIKRLLLRSKVHQRESRQRNQWKQSFQCVSSLKVRCKVVALDLALVCFETHGILLFGIKEKSKWHLDRRCCLNL